MFHGTLVPVNSKQNSIETLLRPDSPSAPFLNRNHGRPETLQEFTVLHIMDEDCFQKCWNVIYIHYVNKDLILERALAIELLTVINCY